MDPLTEVIVLWLCAVLLTPESPLRILQKTHTNITQLEQLLVQMRPAVTTSFGTPCLVASDFMLPRKLKKQYDPMPCDVCCNHSA